jgi:uncharacterized membrane protein
MQNNPQTGNGLDNGKTVAIVSYITLIGWIIALVMHGNNKTSLGAFHLRQSLGIMILAIAVSIIRALLFFIPFIGWAIGACLSLGILILWILGLIAAINAEKKPVPVFGDYFQGWFENFAK